MPPSLSSHVSLSARSSLGHLGQSYGLLRLHGPGLLSLWRRAGRPVGLHVAQLPCPPPPTGTPGLCGQVLGCFAHSHVPRDLHTVRDPLADGSQAWVLGRPSATPGDNLFFLSLRLQGHLKAQRLHRNNWICLVPKLIRQHTDQGSLSFRSIFHWKSNMRNCY